MEITEGINYNHENESNTVKQKKENTATCNTGQEKLLHLKAIKQLHELHAATPKASDSTRA